MDSFLLPSPHSMDQPGAGSSQTYHPLHSRCHNSLGKTTILNKPGPHLMDPKLWCNQWPPGNSNDGQLYLLKLIWKDTWSEQKRGGYGFWTYQISFNAFNETWGEGRFLGCSTLPLKKRHNTSQPFPDKRAAPACHPSPSRVVCRAESLMQLIRDFKLIMRIAVRGVTKSLGLILLNTKATLHWPSLKIPWEDVKCS